MTPTARGRFALAALASLAALTVGSSQPAHAATPITAAALPAGTERVAASSEECTVWRREQSFARAVELHDGEAFAAHLHPGAVFDAGRPSAERGRDAVRASWSEIVRGEGVALRWRAGLVQIAAGEPNIALSRGPYILQTVADGAAAYRVGFYQTVWVRGAAEPGWRVLFDAGASTPLPMADRGAADGWVQAQAMADCAAP